MLTTGNHLIQLLKFLEQEKDHIIMEFTFLLPFPCLHTLSILGFSEAANEAKRQKRCSYSQARGILFEI